MSWNDWLNPIFASEKIDKAALFSAAGDSLWANGQGANALSFEADQIKAIAGGFADATPLQANGIFLGAGAEKDKYFTLRCDDRSIYAKKGKTGIVCVKTKRALIVAHYGETVQPGEAAKVAETLADKLIAATY
ncbi:Pfy1 profilin [Pyronema omphalodes]|nr:Pfy1 profilin [Pyronema omphalodes]